MLHITNGDSVIAGFQAGHIAGEYLPWRDVLHDGPVPQRTSLEALSDVRAAYLADTFGGAGYEAARAEFAKRDRALSSFADHDEVVLWFEHDLYDQLQLLQILAWLADHDISNGRVSLIQIGSHPDVPNFQGLGELNGPQLAALLPTRSPVTPRQLEIGHDVWPAFCADEPTSLCAAAARRYEPDMPFLSAALIRFLEEYPWVRDGLTRTERQLLNVIASGTTRRKALWWASQQFETSWWGDLSIYNRLDALTTGAQPLVERTAADDVALAEAGRRVLDGRERRDLRHVERWLGGVHLGNGRPDWRWNEDEQTVTVSLGR